MTLEPRPTSLSSSREAERVARPTLLPRLELVRDGDLEPAPPGLRGEEAREGTTEVSATPFCFCSKSALAVDKIVQEPRKGGIPSHMRPNRFYSGHWGFFQHGEAKRFSFEKEKSSVRTEIFVSSVSSSTESPAPKIEPGA